MRGGLRVLIGKGTPDDIAQEAKIIGMREHTDIQKFSDEELKRFLMDHRIGIDCSGFAYYVLDAELAAKINRPLASVLKFPEIKNPLRKLLTRFRTPEHTSVAVLAHEKNSKEITLDDVRPGDMIVLEDIGMGNQRDHVLLVHDVIRDEKNTLSELGYTHSFQWSTDGKYAHGVRQGRVRIHDISQTLIHQTWEEQEKTGETNETFLHAQKARTVAIRRLRALE
mgnify:FL=1